jgi:hypothetical protein
MLLVWLGEAIRPTRDADLLGFGDINMETLREIFTELCVMEVEPDGLEFDESSLRVTPIRVEDAYGGQRATLVARLGAARLKVQVDVGIGDAVFPEPLRWPYHAYFWPMNIYTVGYEGMALADFLRQLRRARVQIVVDVRDVPLSRKRGFSKTALAAALDAAGIEYLHIRSLGCPKPIRDRYRTNKDWNAYTTAFMNHLREQTAAVGELAAVCEARVAALLCYEADAGFCHRTYVARAAAAMSGGSVLHIGAAGVTPDRVIAAAA